MVGWAELGGQLSGRGRDAAANVRVREKGKGRLCLDVRAVTGLVPLVSAHHRTETNSDKSTNEALPASARLPLDKLRPQYL